MVTRRTLLVLMVLAVLSRPGLADASQTDRARTRTPAFTAHDRAEIEALIGRYMLALGSCNNEGYAGVFAEPDGYFTSGSRGRVQGRHRLIEMNKSYDCVYKDGVAPPHAPAVLVPYRGVIEPSPSGAVGTWYYNGGHYEDVYVKTPVGWRFKSRTVVTNREAAAGLSAADFDAIHELATKNGGPYIDVYEQISGGSRFKSTGVVIEPSAEGAKGTAYLKQSGHYEDVYVKKPHGWRFASRKYVEDATAGGSKAAASAASAR